MSDPGEREPAPHLPQRPYDYMLSRIIRPALRRQGFVRKGATFWLAGGSGDSAAVAFQRSSGNIGDEIGFYVNLAIILEPWRSWLSFYGASLTKSAPPLLSKAPSPAEGIWWTRLDPTADFDYRGMGMWEICDQVSAECVGSQIVRRLDTDVLPVMRDLLNRERFLQRIQDAQTPFPELRASRIYAELALLVDADNGPAVNRLLSQANPVDKAVHAKFVSWINAYAERCGRGQCHVIK